MRMDRSRDFLRLSQDIVNVEGGAIARGHPIGATETVLILCVGGGEDIGLVLETIA